MCNNDYTLDEVMQVIRDRRDGLQWKRRQLSDEIRDMRNDPECEMYVPEAKRERAALIQRINELDYLLDNLRDDIDEMRFVDSMNDRLYA